MPKKLEEGEGGEYIGKPLFGSCENRLKGYIMSRTNDSTALTRRK